jgi:hypothetical protein
MANPLNHGKPAKKKGNKVKPLHIFMVCIVVLILLVSLFINLNTRVCAKEKIDSADWNVESNAVTNARKLAEASGHTDCTQVIFLYAKGVKETYDKVGGTIMSSFDLIMNPPNDHWRQCSGRLDRILQHDGDNTADIVPPNVMSFEDAITAMPKWKEKDSFIFHQSKDIPLVQRWQRSGLCYIHAAEVVQYYLVALHDKDAGMIDMSKMIRQSFHHKDLQSHIFADEGGSSYSMLERILMPNSTISATDLALAGDRLKKFGPLLISGFVVHKGDFYRQDRLTFDGKPAGDIKGRHAMTIVGHRKDGDGKEWFLVQNWWPQMQFVEISAEYLEACKATLYYVETPQTEIPKNFPVQHHMFADNENVDKPENVNFAEPECPTPKE